MRWLQNMYEVVANCHSMTRTLTLGWPHCINRQKECRDLQQLLKVLPLLPNNLFACLPCVEKPRQELTLCVGLAAAVVNHDGIFLGITEAELPASLC